MELRSSRSRSRTPFISSTYDTEINEDQTGHTVIRTTRSTTKVSSNFDISPTNNNFDSSNSMKTRNSKSEKIVRKTRYKTSDYSSEDGETRISPSLENINNHVLEDSRDSSNRSTGSVSAIDYYRAAGEYWNKYPKTDYTYSLHSKDKTEIAPGVIAMPNMSRRSLHGNDSSNEFMVSHKQTNTDDELQYTPYISSSENVLRTRRTNLFANNNYNAKYKSTFSQDAYTRKSFRSRITSFFLTIFTWISSAFYYMYSTQNYILIKFGKVVHKFATRVMLWDTWLLRSAGKYLKVRLLLAVCLVPLLLFGGWWLFTQLVLPNKAQNYTVHENVKIPIVHKNEKSIFDQPKTDELISKLTSNQLEELANLIKFKLDSESQSNSDEIVEKIVANAKVQSLLNKFSKLEGSNGAESMLRRQEEIIAALKIEIDKIRLELLQLEKVHNKDVANLIAQLRSEHELNMAKMTVKISRCCRTSVIQMENYITNMLKDLFQAPGSLGTYKDISQWIRSTYVAKEDLEARLSNITQNLHSNFDTLIRNNGDIIMGEVMSRVTAELSQRIKRAQVYPEDTNTIHIDSITDERIKKIVQQSLNVYDADKTGLVDYALESAGGEILTVRCTESYNSRTAALSIFGVRIWYPTNTPRTVITPGVVPGECWAFQSFPGFLVIKLAARIKIEAFSYEHMSKLLAPDGKIDSAPKDFFVYGLQNETDSDPLLLGEYSYDSDGPPLQYFPSRMPHLAFNIVELKIISNHGNPNYSCLYRFRVHGQLDSKPSS